MWGRNRLEQLSNPYHISDRYEFPNSNYYGHTLKGITNFVLPDSVEGRLIQYVVEKQHTDTYYQYASEFKKHSKEYKDYCKDRGFDWDNEVTIEELIGD